MGSVMIGMLVSMGFTALLLAHAYWLTGGTMWRNAILPSDSADAPNLPSRSQLLLRTVIVFLLKLLVLGAAGMLGTWLPEGVFQTGGFLAALVLFVRAIGDTKYRGITKKVKDTPFARADSKLYTPLCFGLALLTFLTSLHF